MRCVSRREMRALATPVCGLITVDVEADNLWIDTHSKGMSNIPFLHRFHQLCMDLGQRPTYLVSYPVAIDDEASKVLTEIQATGQCEIGAHAHLWEIPPMQTNGLDAIASFARAYPDELLTSKLVCLHETLNARFGTITSFRAGRWGLEERQFQFMRSHGYLADTSVTPGTDWSCVGGPDFRESRSDPHWLGGGKPETDGGIVEVPCTLRPPWRLAGIERTRIGRALARRLGLAESWLRCLPGHTFGDLKMLCEWALANGAVHLNLATHSSELCAGTSPYWPDEQSVRRHLQCCGEVFRWWKDHGVTPATLSGFAGKWRELHPCPDQSDVRRSVPI